MAVPHCGHVWGWVTASSFYQTPHPHYNPFSEETPRVGIANKPLPGLEWAARQFYSLGSIVERMARSRTGLWWNIVRNLGYHLALRNFGDVGFNPEAAQR